MTISKYATRSRSIRRSGPRQRATQKNRQSKSKSRRRLSSRSIATKHRNRRLTTRDTGPAAGRSRASRHTNRVRSRSSRPVPGAKSRTRSRAAVTRRVAFERTRSCSRARISRAKKGRPTATSGKSRTRAKRSRSTTYRSVRAKSKTRSSESKKQAAVWRGKSRVRSRSQVPPVRGGNSRVRTRVAAAAAGRKSRIATGKRRQNGEMIKTITKRKMSAYNMYFREQLTGHRVGNRSDMSEAIRAVAQRWKNMSSTEKDRYKIEEGLRTSPVEQDSNNTLYDDVEDWSPSDKDWLGASARQESVNEHDIQKLTKKNIVNITPSSESFQSDSTSSSSLEEDDN